MLTRIVNDWNSCSRSLLPATAAFHAFELLLKLLRIPLLQQQQHHISSERKVINELVYGSHKISFNSSCECENDVDDRRPTTIHRVESEPKKKLSEQRILKKRRGRVSKKKLLNGRKRLSEGEEDCSRLCTVRSKSPVDNFSSFLAFAKKKRSSYNSCGIENEPRNRWKLHNFNFHTTHPVKRATTMSWSEWRWDQLTNLIRIRIQCLLIDSRHLRLIVRRRRSSESRQNICHVFDHS